ncbi:MAG: AAA family ATPase [Planctomycetaceae bacterium]|jgi:chromosomal replication initiator protein|nr:AAA family ATPase [Planctomycetaceae bacterium]
MDNLIRVIPFSGKPIEFDAETLKSLGTIGSLGLLGNTGKSAAANENTKTDRHLIFQPPEHGFLVGPENYIVGNVVDSILDGGLTRERLPVFFYGQSGTGKTHLIQGIFNSRRKKSVKRNRDILLTSSDFARLFTEAIEFKSTDSFRRRIRGVTMLLIDDIEQFSSKPAVQDEFQHTIDMLTANDIPVILTGKTLPKFPKQLADRIICGTTVPVVLPGFEVRKHFLSEVISALHLPISAESVDAAAKELPISIPAIYGLITRMTVEAIDAKAKPDTRYFRQFLKNNCKTTRPSIEQIAKNVAKYFAFKLSDLKGISRKKTVADARAIAVYLARKETGLPIKEIAKFFGQRDTSTIRHLIEKIESNIKTDSTLKNHIANICPK